MAGVPMPREFHHVQSNIADRWHHATLDTDHPVVERDWALIMYKSSVPAAVSRMVSSFIQDWPPTAEGLAVALSDAREHATSLIVEAEQRLHLSRLQKITAKADYAALPAPGKAAVIVNVVSTPTAGGEFGPMTYANGMPDRRNPDPFRPTLGVTATGKNLPSNNVPSSAKKPRRSAVAAAFVGAAKLRNHSVDSAGGDDDAVFRRALDSYEGQQDFNPGFAQPRRGKTKKRAARRPRAKAGSGSGSDVGADRDSDDGQGLGAGVFA